MPAQRLRTEPVDIRQFDVVGQDAGPATPHFVRHLALSSNPRPGHSPPEPLALTHMGPPLAVDQPEVIHVCGSVPLTQDQIEQVGVFVDGLQSEYEAQRLRRPHQQYCVHPHVAAVRATDGTVITYRYSCAGFVIEAYRSAGVELVATDDGRLPGVTVDALLAAYPDLESVLTDPARRAQWAGLIGDGPWPVVLPGYVLHALDRLTNDILAGAYTAQPGDECFPRRSSAA